MDNRACSVCSSVWIDVTDMSVCNKCRQPCCPEEHNDNGEIGGCVKDGLCPRCTVASKKRRSDA